VSGWQYNIAATCVGAGGKLKLQLEAAAGIYLATAGDQVLKKWPPSELYSWW
jgi:hypothetical protein